MMGPAEGSAASAFVMAAVQTVKTMIPKKWYGWALPLLALVLSIVYSMLISPNADLSTGEQILEGFRNGFAAIGLFAVGVKPLAKIKEAKDEDKTGESSTPAPPA